MTKIKKKIMKDGSWRKVASDKILQGAGTQLIQTYIDKRQASVEEWVDSQPIFDI